MLHGGVSVELLTVELLRLCTSHNSYYLWCEIKFRCSYLEFALSSSKWRWMILECDLSLLISNNVSWNRSDSNIWMRLDFFNFIFKIDRTVTININNFCICLTNFTAFAHVDWLWDQLILFRVDYWESMDWYQNFVTFAVDSNWIIEILVLVVRSELNVDVFTDSWWNHSFFVVFYLKEWGLWRKNVKSLGSWRIVYQFYFQYVGLS